MEIAKSAKQLSVLASCQFKVIRTQDNTHGLNNLPKRDRKEQLKISPNYTVSTVHLWISLQ